MADKGNMLSRLRGSAFVRAVFWEATGTAGKQIAGFLVAVVLARLLSPADFGLVGMAMAFVAFAEVFLDGGFSSVIIQTPDLDQVALTTIFYFNLALGFLLTGALWLAADTLATFYGNPEVGSIARSLSFMFLLYATSSAQTSLLRKRLQQRLLATGTVTGLVIGGAVAISLAWSGWGVWALVAQQYVAFAVRTAWVWWGSDWRPTGAVSFAAIRGQVRFGTTMFLAQLVARFFSHFDTLVLGRAYAATLVGFFYRARSLLDMAHKFTTKPVANVFFPYASKHQADPELLAMRTLQALRYVGVLLVPAAVLVYLNAERFILIVFGDQWSPAVPLVQVLVFEFHVAPVGAIAGGVLGGTGAGQRLLGAELAKRVFSAALQLLGLSLGGMQAYLWCLVVGGNLGLLVDAWAMRRTLGIPVGRLLAEIYGIPCLLWLLCAASISLAGAGADPLVATLLFLMPCAAVVAVWVVRRHLWGPGSC